MKLVSSLSPAPLSPPLLLQFDEVMSIGAGVGMGAGCISSGRIGSGQWWTTLVGMLRGRSGGGLRGGLDCLDFSLSSSANARLQVAAVKGYIYLILSDSLTNISLH